MDHWNSILPSAQAKAIIACLSFILIFDLFNNYQSLNALNYLPSSRLLKSIDNPTVFYVNQNRLKMAIPSAQVFLSYGAKWEDIEIVGEAELDFYKDAEYIKLIGNARVYQLKDGVKRYLTQKAASALKIFPEEVIPVNRAEFNAYTIGETLDEAEAIALRTEKDAALISQRENQICVPDESVGGEDGCRIFEAMEKKDSSLCDSITSEEWKAKCYMSVVPESGDYLANCKKLLDSDFKNQCISQTALAKNNSLLCSEISDAGKKQFCESGIKISQKDINACDNLPEGDAAEGRNVCLNFFAVANTDIRACEKISVASIYKKSCDDFFKQQLYVQKKLQPTDWLAKESFKILFLIRGKSASAQTNPTDIPVVGRFLPGAFDIYTFIPYCGITVSVAGPRPGVFLWVPNRIYDYFLETIYHVELNMLGLGRIAPPCVPHLFMLGSGLTPI